MLEPWDYGRRLYHLVALISKLEAITWGELSFWESQQVQEEPGYAVPGEEGETRSIWVMS